ncbi:MAG: flagellar basal body P-ring formation protein FlgA [Rhizobiales bacterium]|nr:flagellar basal body P-ring formation protein FlgA [Hyphomicrobiales bacterium]
MLTAAWPAAPAHAETMSLPVPLRTIYPKDTVNKADFTFKEYEVNEVARRNYVISLSQLEQQVAARALPAGRPVPLRSLKRASDVSKGQQVVARYVSHGIEIQGILVPEQDGVIGDTVRVRNPETGVSLLARVAPDGTLAVEGD